jgi:threonine/homoserine/homoserine lactone efflux protein
MNILLAIIGMWNITDGWFSMSLYWGMKAGDRQQTFWKDHYIRVIRIIIGIMLIYIAYKL